jgi:hypothetical protein
MSAHGDRVRVLYIAGAGRSGSTLLECILGELPGVVAAGEVTHLWERGLRQNQLCGCGTPLRECAFWRRVLESFPGGLDAREIEELATLRNSLSRLRNIPRFVWPALRTRRFQGRLQRYADALVHIYRAVRDVAGARVVVDSSKYPAEAFLLRAIGAIDLGIVHLVRDSNAVAYAWQKRLLRPDVHWTRAYMARYPFVKTALGWNAFNLVLGTLRSLDVPYVRIRYEDLVREPREPVRSICRTLGLGAPSLAFLRDGGVELGENHTASGNPSRFRRGLVALRLDTEWNERVPRLQRVAVHLLTFPLRRKYGYR